MNYISDVWLVDPHPERICGNKQGCPVLFECIGIPTLLVLPAIFVGVHRGSSRVDHRRTAERAANRPRNSHHPETAVHVWHEDDTGCRIDSARSKGIVGLNSQSRRKGSQNPDKRRYAFRGRHSKCAETQLGPVEAFWANHGMLRTALDAQID